MVNLETIMSELNELEAKEIFTIPYNSTRINHRENAECLQAFAKEQLEVSDKFDSPAFAFENIDIHAGFEPPKSVKVGNYTLREYRFFSKLRLTLKNRFQYSFTVLILL